MEASEAVFSVIGPYEICINNRSRVDQRAHLAAAAAPLNLKTSGD